ncbi:hypothetical protein V1Y59_12435 [Gordonia sp. PKS22-38]|uniref:MspA protein n=1 Tax=Gordonia prachuapensis TaxID=3115651 RepID=A0ABU7MU79_9ACTN|nr:hypothetical protein [Gordonia sp. PKS22-38]
MNTKRIIAGALIGGAAVMGISLGAGNAEAKIEPGQYKSQRFTFGFIPTPESNVRVVGNRMYQDYYGLGPWNYSSGPIFPTRDGGVVATSSDPTMQWISSTKYTKTDYGYKGVYSEFGIPLIDTTLKKVR